MSAIDRTLLRKGTAGLGSGRGFEALLRRAVRSFMQLAERVRGRRALLELNDRLLKDIGLTRADVDRECAKPFRRP